MSKYLIIFDDHCAVCDLGAQVLSKSGLLKKTGFVPLSTAQSNPVACHIDPVKSCDEMALVNPQTREVHYGMDAYGILAAERNPFLGRVFKNDKVKFVLNPLYLFIASNRRILAPLNMDDSVCKPTLRKGYRLTLIILLTLFAATVTYIKGELFAVSPTFDFLSGFKLLQVVSVGWLVVALSYREQDKWEYWGHLSMIAGTAIFIQSIALLAYYFLPHLYWILGSMAFSDLFMVFMHHDRIRKMGKPQSYTFKWWLILHLTAAVSLVMYYG